MLTREVMASPHELPAHSGRLLALLRPVPPEEK
jgi:hypothetical protein